MLTWFAREKKVPGWLVLSMDADTLRYAHGRFERGAKSQISVYGAQGVADKQGLQKTASTMKLGRYECAVLLRPSEYQLLLVDSPSVPREELKSAIRWKIKDMIDYHVDDAAVDVLDIPPPEGGDSRNHMMFAVSANNEIIQAKIREFEEAHIALRVIDIPETAQRNIAALYEEQERGVALAYFGLEAGLLTITHRGELYLTRRLDVGVDALAADPDGEDGGPVERVALEIQRTLDHFERQFRHVAVGRLLLAPTGRPTRLPEILRARFEMPVAAIDLSEVLAFGGAAPDAVTQWRLFHHFGAALREGTA